MRKALYFDDDLAFCDFVRLFGSKADRTDPGQPFELCRVLHPDRPGESALVLFHCKPPLDRQLRHLVQPIDAEIDLADKTLFWNLERSPSSPVTRQSRGQSLLEFVELQPWRARRSPQPAGPLLFWITGSEDERAARLAKLVRDSFRLGNDRIQFGQLADESGGEITLLKIESPSFFLVQACLEDASNAIELYYPAGDHRFVRWGFSHPLETWWDRAAPSEDSRWLFFRDRLDYLHVDPVAWRDAYDLAEISLEFPHRQIWAKSPGAPPRFEVPLTLVTKLAAAEPELWLLDDAGVRQLEKTLQVIDDESLRSWQIAVQRLGENEEARDWVFVRESHAGKKRRQHHDFSGTGFARYRGLNNLYLPVGRDLQPPLRRDAYRALFQLEPDTLTLLAPDDSNASGYQILRLREKAFDALGSFVDYLVERDAGKLEDLMAGSLFDLGDYLKAPKHPGLAPDRRDADPKNGGAFLQSETAEAPGSFSEDAERPDSNALADRLEQPATGTDESRLSDWQREELRLEREIISSGQTAERWSALFDIKARLGKAADAILCATEALWIAPAAQQEALARILDELVGAEFASADDAATTAANDPEWQRRAAALLLAARRPEEPAQLDRWIGEMSAFLRIHDEGLRAKERWLNWGAVLSANRDLRRETQLREEIRTCITERGLGLEETPAFIRSRIFLDRNEFGSNDPAGTNAAAARSNIEVLRNAGLGFESRRLRKIHRAVLARACSQVNDLGPVSELADSRTTESDECLAAWETGLLIMALQQLDPARAQSLENDYLKQLDQTDEDTARSIRELREFYDDRNQADNPAAFLARENRGRTYPRGAATESGLLYELSMDLERHSLDGNEPGAVQVMRTMMNIGEPAEYDDAVKLPQFIETLVTGLERFKWGERGAALVPVFENFSDRVPGFLSNRKDDFYGAILHSNLALGLLTVENLEKAVSQLGQAVDAAARNTIELDFIDSASAVIRTIEQLPLSRRAPFLETLMKAFTTLFDEPQSPYVKNERLFAVLAKFLNQMAEAAASRDRLSLEQFRHYQLQDEFLILQRIQSERFCEAWKE